MMPSWRWAGACSIGTSHLKSNLECQDRASCMQIVIAEREYLSIVVSDGAGSAERAAQGASIVCTGFQRLAVTHLRNGKSLDDIDEETVAGWLDEIRERISVQSKKAGLRPRDYAATLVAAIIGPDSAVIAHVGDGAAVLRNQATREWIVPSWPFHGEYASTTRFVVDDPQPVISLVLVEGKFDRAAVFSDGMERLVLDHRERSAPAGFFDRLTGPVANCASHGRDRKLSKHLKSYLDSEKVCEATDDDKSLVLGARS